MMMRKSKFSCIAILSSFAAAFFGAAAADARGCAHYVCDTVVTPLPYPYRHYHYLIHSPSHDYAPIYFSDGHGGGYYGQWFWGGQAWRVITPDDNGGYRFGW